MEQRVRNGQAVGSPMTAHLGPFFLLICRQCEPEIPMPFASAEERGRWAGAHTRGTGHDQWRVWEESDA